MKLFQKNNCPGGFLAPGQAILLLHRVHPMHFYSLFSFARIKRKEKYIIT